MQAADSASLNDPPRAVIGSISNRTIALLFTDVEGRSWSKWGRDWERRATAARIALHGTAGIRAGDDVLLHYADHYGARGNWRATRAVAATGLAAASVRRRPARCGLALTI